MTTCICGGRYAVFAGNSGGHRWDCPGREAPAADPLIVQAIVGLPMRLKAHRAAHDLSLREVAKRTGMSFSTVHRIESGEDYAVSHLLALAAYLDGAA